MIQLPDFEKSFEYENNFYLSCDITRISKVIAHYELFKITNNLPGSIVECGVFKGVSLTRFAVMRELFENPFSKKIIAFDTFGDFPEAGYEGDKNCRTRFVETAGDQSISREQLVAILEHKKINKWIELIEGDINLTVPAYVKAHPELKISLLNLDTDLYEPSLTVLEHLYSRIVRNGLLILDDYGTFPGETKAVDEYFKDKDVEIKKFPFCATPCYVVKK